MDQDKKTKDSKLKTFLEFCYKHADKLLHVLGAYSFLLCGTVFFGRKGFIPVLVATGLLSIIKEILDEIIGPGAPHAGDLVADMIGLAGAFATAMIGGLL